MTMPETTQSDLVERLRFMQSDGLFAAINCGMAAGFGEAADEITRLRAHCKAMSTGLQLAYTMLEDYDGSQSHAGDAFKVLDMTLAAYRTEGGV